MSRRHSAKKYKVLQYDRFFQPGYDLCNVWFFETLEAAEKFMANCEESKRKWPRIYGKNEYILEEVQMKLEKGKTFMKVLVDKLPDKSENCIFYKEEASRTPYSMDLCITYRCSIDGKRCNCGTCDKLKAV